MLRSTWRRLPLSLFLPLLILGAFRLNAQSQATTGIIRGVVVDPNGAAVASAQVTVHESQTNFQRTVVTDSKGNFAASLLPLGTYDVTARAVGLNQATQKGLTLRVGATVDLRLTLAAITLQAVTVTATNPVVDATRIESSTRLPNQAVEGLPNNGHNYLNLTLLTPNVATVQGPDGDELTVAGQRGIHNNVAVDGADFNNPFFGEQRGGQRPAFTFNLDAVQEVVVTASGANAEFGRSGGGFVNVITKSGTNELHGVVHYYGKYDALSGDPSHTPAGGGPVQTFTPDFSQHQIGFSLGGPIKRDRAFFLVAYDMQLYDEIKQRTRPQSAALDSLKAWMDTAFGGALRGDFGPIARTNDARAFLAKFDFRLSERHNLSLKYNYTWSEQKNGTFDVDSWAASANGLEKDKSNAVNGSLVSYLSSAASNEFRFQYSREDRPRPYVGPRTSLLGPDPTGTGLRPFPDIAMDFGNTFRFGLPFFLPIDYYDTRVQLLDNVSLARGNHFFKAGVEWNRVESVQTFIGFANSRFIFNSVSGFLGYVGSDSMYVTCSNGPPRNDGQCPDVGNGPGNITGPVLLYLQQAGVNRTVREAGTQSIPQNEFAVYLQDTWKPDSRWTINYGLRWEAQIEPDPITPPSQVYFAPLIGQSVTNAQGTFTFPSDGTIPSDKKMFQPRLGLAFDPDGSGRQVFRGSAGLYYARIPGLNLASTRSTNGSIGYTLFGSSGTVPFNLPPPSFPNLFPSTVSAVQVPGVFVFDKNFQNPRTFSATVAYERQLGATFGLSLSFTHARTDHLTRFINRNDAAFGSPWSTTTPVLGSLTVVESSARSRYSSFTVGLKRVLDPHLQFEANYTLSFDKSDDDNERDPFTFRYARADNLGPDYNWSDRDQRHRFNGWLLAEVKGFYLNNRVSVASAQPVSEACVNNQPSGQRASSAAARICTNGTILKRNTLRKDNAYFSWDIRISRSLPIGRPGQQLEALVEIFNVTGNDNFKDPAYGNLVFNFDGTIRSGLGDPRQLQVGARWSF